MAVPGTMGKIAMVDLDSGKITIETPGDDLYLRYLGGYGLGVHYLYKLQKPGVDALGPDNLLGFFTGVLTGTPGLSANRYVVVAKSPKTGTWGDANSGGEFGPAMKAAGFDGAIFSGTSREPVYLLLKDGRAQLLPADQWWGLDSEAVDAKAKDLYGAKARATCIGPAGERVALLSCIINDKGRALGRSGLGAVMGSKRLKAIVALGDAEVPVHDRQGLKDYVALHRSGMKQDGLGKILAQYGTAGITAACCAAADSPIKNWAGVPDDFPTAHKISDDAVMDIQNKKYACWRCAIACGGETEVRSGPYASKSHKPEYETLAAFGTMCLNDNLQSIHLCNALCNQHGLDTISTGCTVAFAIECYENGILTNEDTGNLQLTWGSSEAVAELTRQIAEGTGFGGKVLADGVKVAAERIGKGARQYAVHIQGEEVPMHDPRLYPGLATSYKMDATPARHTQSGAWTFECGGCPPGLIEKEDEFDKYAYSGKGRAHRIISNNGHVMNSAGMCLFAWYGLHAEVLPRTLYHVTGHKYTLKELDEIGGRIAALRIAFNLREGLRNIDFELHGRLIGSPPLEAGPLEGVTVDVDTQVAEYLEAMGWDPQTGVPRKETLLELGLDNVAADLYA